MGVQSNTSTSSRGEILELVVAELQSGPVLSGKCTGRGGGEEKRLNRQCLVARRMEMERQKAAMVDMAVLSHQSGIEGQQQAEWWRPVSSW